MKGDGNTLKEGMGYPRVLWEEVGGDCYRRTRVVSEIMGVVGGLRCTPSSGIYGRSIRSGDPRRSGRPVGLSAVDASGGDRSSGRPVGLCASSLFTGDRDDLFTGSRYQHHFSGYLYTWLYGCPMIIS